jgi:hypothetical protein
MPCRPVKSSELSEEHIASIFRIEEEVRQKNNTKKATSTSSLACVYFMLTHK